MFGKKCTLCGGKLDKNQICTECGLNNSQSEKNYRINQSSCDHMPLTHVHADTEKTQSEQKTKSIKKRTEWTEEKIPKDSDQKKRTQQQYSGNVREKNKVKKKIRFAVILPVFVVFVLIVQLLGAIIGGFFYEKTGYEAMMPYEELEEQGEVLSEDGETFETELLSGQYIVGVHLPEGNYISEPQEDYDVVKVSDRKHGIYLYEYKGKEEENYLDDLRLYEGAIVTVSAQKPVLFRTENGQPVQTMENPLQDTYEIRAGETMKAGVDFTPGVYDFSLIRGSGKAEAIVCDDSGEEYRNYTFYLGEGNTDGTEFKNLILPEGAEITLEDWSGEEGGEGFCLSMQPSEQIVSEDYLGIYEEYEDL